MFRRIFTGTLCLVATVLFFVSHMSAQDKPATPAATPAAPPYAAVLKDAKAIPGLLQLHQKGNSLHVELMPGDYGNEYIVLISISRGISQGPLRILVVEDNKDAADSLAMLLRIHCGHAVDVAYSGLQALQLANVHRPDVVLLDLGLPTLNGFQVAEELRAMPEAAAMVIIAITGHSYPEAVEASTAAGIDMHLIKPVDIQHLLRYLSGRGLN